jgi:hypothetical protein
MGLELSILDDMSLENVVTALQVEQYCKKNKINISDLLPQVISWILRANLEYSDVTNAVDKIKQHSCAICQEMFDDHTQL